MFAGHYAYGLALKARLPRAPTWALLLGIGAMDLVFGALCALGVERATITPGEAPGFRLDFIDWSHSLASAIVLSVLCALPFLSRGKDVAAAVGMAVFSHFPLDWLMHPGDMVLAPHTDTHVGLGLWSALPVGWWFVELAFVLLCCGYYVVKARRGDGSWGGRAEAAAAVVLALHVSNSPWFSVVR